MPMTIPQYAKSRRVSDKGVYKAIDRHPEIKALIYIGKPNGKAVQMLSDEAMGMLDRVMRHPFQGIEDLQKDIQIFHNEELLKKDSEIEELRKQISEQKDAQIAEMGKTRESMISAVRKAVSETVAIDYDKINASLNELKSGLLTVEQSALIAKENKDLKEKNRKLQKQIEEKDREYQDLRREFLNLQRILENTKVLLEKARNHPVINWIEFKRRKHNNEKS